MSEAVTCPWCGGVEPSEWHLSINHWVREREPGAYDWCAAHDMCIAMSLTRAHVQSYARRGGGADRPALLARAIERAEQLWAKAGTEWLDEYRDILRPIEPPTHHAVPESIDVDLFSGVA